MTALLPDVVVSTMRTGFFLEVPVNPDAGPYLVTANKTLLWLPTHYRGLIRSAIRSGGMPEGAYAEVVREVLAHGRRAQWSNSFAADRTGLIWALEHLRYYGLDDLELLVATGESNLYRSEGVKDPEGVAWAECSWVPSGSAVLVPADRQYLGLVAVLKDAYSLVVHNPSRGMAILGEW